MGMHGWKHVNKAIQSADLLIALGMRFDDRVTGSVSTYAPNAQIIHVDIDPTEIGKNVAVDIPIVGDVGNVLRAFIKAVPEVDPAERQAYFDELAEWRTESEAISWHGSGGSKEGLLTADFVMQRLGELTDHDATRRGRCRPAPDVAGPLRRLHASRQPTSARAAWAPWASACPRPWVRRSVGPTRRPGRSSATAACR